MKFDDSDNDYFLHDFSKENQKENLSERETITTNERENSGSAESRPSFVFGDSPQPSSSKSRRKKHHFLTYFFLTLFIILAVTVYVRYFVPYITESRTTGYVTLVEKRGILFHTFEGEMVSEALLTDTSRIYSRDLYFSIPDDSLALRLQKYQSTGRPVTVTCKRYYGTLPWRGASNIILSSFEPVD